MALVVQPHSHNLAGLARMEQLHIGELVSDTGGGVVAEKIAAKLADGAAVQNAI